MHELLPFLKNLLLVAAGGAIGAAGRYTVNGLAHRVLGAGFPYGTLIVNLVGCFLMGILAETALHTTWISFSMRLALGVGFLGALTTFSTFGVETLDRMHEGQWGIVLLNVAANVVLGLLCVWLGIIVARWIVH